MIVLNNSVINVTNTIDPHSLNLLYYLWTSLGPILGSIIATSGSGILNYLVQNKKNPYINSIKLYYPHMETFLEIKKWYGSSRYFSSFFLFIGTVIGIFIEILILEIFLIIYHHISVIFHMETVASNYQIIWLVVILYTSVIISTICLFRFFPIESRNLLCIDFTDSYRFKRSNLVMYVKLCLFLGIMFGAIITVWGLFYNLKSASNIIVFSNNSLFIANILLTTYVLSCIVNLAKKHKSFSDDFIDPISKLCICNFPHVKIKTHSGEVEGKLRDVHNKDFVILSGKNILNIVSWDKIEKIEVCNINNKEPPIFDNDSINDK